MLFCQSGRGAARLARLHGVQEVGGSNPLAPTLLPRFSHDRENRGTINLALGEARCVSDNPVTHFAFLILEP